VTNEEFKKWRKELGYSQADAAEALGLSKGSIENYERGYRLDNQSTVYIPRVVELACKAVMARLA